MEKILYLFIAAFLIVNCNNSVTDSDEYKIELKKDFEFVEPEFTGNIYYVDPVNGSADGDGSLNNPWRTLQEVIDSGLIKFYSYSENYNINSELVLENENGIVQGGDKIILREGYHGYITLSEMMFDDWLTIEAYTGEEPVFSRINFTGAFKKIYMKNLTVDKSSFVGDEPYWTATEVNYNTSSCLYLGSSDFWGDCRELKFNGLKIKTTDDISSWNADTWVERAASGISVRSAKNIDIVNCEITNISMGITLDYNSDSCNVAYNSVKNYSGDGARLCSNYCFFGYNRITDCYKVDENHDDGIQSFSRGANNESGGGVLCGNVVRGNVIIGTTDFTNNLAGNPQGIGCFDGMFEDWVIENNIVITSHYHGISFYGLLNSQILNNTVLDQSFDDGMAPWIRVNNHKSGAASNNCIVANNISTSSIYVEGENIVTVNNFVVGSNNQQLYEHLFKDYSSYDVNLNDNDSTQLYLIDKGTVIDNTFSSLYDQLLIERNILPDIGAMELN